MKTSFVSLFLLFSMNLNCAEGLREYLGIVIDDGETFASKLIINGDSGSISYVSADAKQAMSIKFTVKIENEKTYLVQEMLEMKLRIEESSVGSIIIRNKDDVVIGKLRKSKNDK